MKITVPKESDPCEKRIALTPSCAMKLKALEIEIDIEQGLGEHLGFSDAEYQKAGCHILSDKQSLLAEADMVLRVKKPSNEEIQKQKRGSMHLSFLDPFKEKELLKTLKDSYITSFSLEMMPRSTTAQKMDALSSQANLAGYGAVIAAAKHSNKIFPMMTTPAGTIFPLKVLVIGAGVAGLQAIATARRLGAKVEAFDTRAIVEEQVKSLGAKFLKIDLGETEQTKQGYAQALSAEQLKKQQEGLTAAIAASDIVITTALVFGKKAPLIVTKEMMGKMKKKSIIVDLAVESGGNVEGSLPDQSVDIFGVTVLGLGNLPCELAATASEMYSSNLTNFILHFYHKEKNAFTLDFASEILKGCTLTHAGQIVHPLLTHETFSQGKGSL